MSNSNIFTGNDTLRKIAADGTVNTASNFPVNWAATNAGLSITDIADFRLSPRHFSIRLAPLNASDDVTLSITVLAVDTVEHHKALLVSHVNVLCEEGLGVTGVLQSVPGEPLSHVSQVFENVFTACRTGMLAMPEDNPPNAFSISYTFSGHEGKPIHVTTPYFHDDVGFFDLSAVRVATNYMPNVYWDKDSAATDPSYPLHKLIAALSQSTQNSINRYKQFFDWELKELSAQADDSLPKYRSGLVDPGVAETRFLPWLSQFSGKTIVGNISSVERTITYDTSHTAADTSNRLSTEISYCDFVVGPSHTVNALNDHEFEVTDLKLRLGNNGLAADTNLSNFLTDASTSDGLLINGVDFTGQTILIDDDQFWYKFEISNVTQVGSTNIHYEVDVAKIFVPHPNTVDFAGTFADTFAAGLSTTAAWSAGTPNTVNGFRLAYETKTPVREYFSDPDTFVRQQIESGFYGVHSGTSAAVMKAAQQVLTGDKQVGIIPLYGGTEPGWTFSIRTVNIETPEYDIATLRSETVENAVQEALPAGYRVYHQAWSGLGFVLDSNSLGVLDVSRLG